MIGLNEVHWDEHFGAFDIFVRRQIKFSVILVLLNLLSLITNAFNIKALTKAVFFTRTTKKAKV